MILGEGGSVRTDGRERERWIPPPVCVENTGTWGGGEGGGGGGGGRERGGGEGN